MKQRNNSFLSFVLSNVNEIIGDSSYLSGVGFYHKYCPITDVFVSSGNE